MAEITKETVTTKVSNDDTAAQPEVAVTQNEETPASTFQTIEYVVYFFFGVLDVLLIIRIFLKLLGANPESGFVNLIYSLTGIFTYLFEGIFSSNINQGLETTSVFEWSTLIAIIIYGLLAWGIVALIRVLSGKKQVE